MRAAYLWLAVGGIFSANVGCSDDPSGTTPEPDAGSLDTGSLDAVVPLDGPVVVDGGDGGPVVDAGARPIWPPSGATVSGHRPALRWRLEGAADGARVELCKERACTNVLATLDVKGSTAAPTTDLPAGRVYWRVRGASGANVAAKSSATWEMKIPAHASATVQSAYGAGRDYDGDGFDDVVFIEGTSFQIHAGGPSGPSSVAVNLTFPWGYGDWSLGGFTVAPAGDVNGDGYSDLLVSSRDVGAAIFYGSPTGLAASPPTLLKEAGFQYGQSSSAAGDVNDDGYADVVVGSNEVGIQTVPVFVYGGSAAGLGKVAIAKLVEPLPPECQVACGSAGFGGYVAGACDINGDGRPDLLVAGRRGVFEFHGGATAFDAVPAIPNITSGYDFVCALDVDGDGRTDVAAVDTTSATKNVALVFHGRAGGLDATDVIQAVTPTLTTGVGVPTPSLVGDVDGDGLDDVGVRAYSTNAYSGLRGFVFGGTKTTFGSPILAIPTIATYELDATGDVNGDGLDDVLANVNNACDSRVFVGGKPPATTALIGWNASGKCLP